MTCPICGGATKVTETATDVEAVYRCRVCVECGEKFYTEELESNVKNRLHSIRYASKKLSDN